MRIPAPTPAEFFAAQRAKSTPPDPADQITRYLLALNATLAELRADMAEYERNPISVWAEREAAHRANYVARREVYAEIQRVTTEGTITPPEPSVGLAEAPKSNNTPLAPVVE